MTHDSRTRERGMTLVEIVIALAILGMIAALALGGIRIGVRTWETVGQRVETDSHDRIVRAFLRRTLSQASSALERDADRQLHPVFAGDGKSLLLVAPLAEHLGLGGLQRLEFSVAEGRGDEGYGLVMTRTPYYPPNDTGETPADDEPERHVLIEGASRIKFDYLRELENGSREWTGHWTDEQELPLAIRLAVESRGDAAPEPELIVPLRVTMVSRRQ